MISARAAKRIAGIFAIALAQHAALNAATITIVPSDPPGQGLNDPTLGAARLAVFQTAANQWGKLLNSAVTIKVDAKFASIPGGCNHTSAILGQAGPSGFFASFTHAPKANVFYPVALADSLKGSSINGTTAQIDATFNADIDNGNCLDGHTWSYATTPTSPQAGKIFLLPVVFHELGHGLGFLTATDSTDGSFVPIGGGQFLPDIWDFYLFDQTQNKTWAQINPTGAANSTIVSSSISGTNLVWAGKHVNKLQKQYLTGSPPAGTNGGCMNLYAPSPLQDGSSVSHWTKAATPDLLMEPALNQTLFNSVDLTLPLFQDIGWSTNPEKVLFYDGFDANPCPHVQP
jgi:hypothetical protein